MKTISLTQNKVALVDDADYNFLNCFKWYAKKMGHSYYAMRHSNIGNGKQKTEYMHRVILGFQPDDKRQTDHIDGNGLNNQRSNLRVCTVTQNQQYSRKQVTGKSRYKGVNWDCRDCRWKSQIQVNGQKIHLGLFLSEVKAAQVYDVAAIKHFGEFARTNKMMGLF